MSDEDRGDMAAAMGDMVTNNIDLGDEFDDGGIIRHTTVEETEVHRPGADEDDLLGGQGTGSVWYRGPAQDAGLPARESRRRGSGSQSRRKAQNEPAAQTTTTFVRTGNVPFDQAIDDDAAATAAAANAGVTTAATTTTTTTEPTTTPPPQGKLGVVGTVKKWWPKRAPKADPVATTTTTAVTTTAPATTPRTVVIPDMPLPLLDDELDDDEFEWASEARTSTHMARARALAGQYTPQP